MANKRTIIEVARRGQHGDYTGAAEVADVTAALDGSADSSRAHRAHTGVIVAASNSPTWMKRMADYVCDGTADDVEWQAAIDEAQAPSATLMLDVILLPGTYNLASQVTWGACNIVGKGGLVAHGVRVNWAGALGATVIVKTNGGAGGMSGVSFRGPVSGGNKPGTWIDFTADQVDKFCRLSEVHFINTTGPLVKVGSWYNLHWSNLRFDTWGTYAITFDPGVTPFLASAVIDGFTADNGNVASNGLIYLNDTGGTNGGVFELRNGRVELHTVFAAPSGLVHIEHTGGSIFSSMWGVKLSNIAFQDNTATKTASLLYRTAASTTARDTLILDNVRQSAINAVVAGAWSTGRALPPVQNNYPMLVYGDNDPILDALTIRGSSGAGARPLAVRVGNESEDRLYVANDGSLYFGPGSSAPDVRTYRSGSATLRVNPNLAVTGSTTIGGNLDHDGTQVGFYNKTPVNQPAANPDTSGASLTDLETEVNQLKAALRALGLIAT